MRTRYITDGAEGNIVVIQIVGDDPDGRKLTKSLYELSRTTEMEIPFDSARHTRSAIAAGIQGHRPLNLLGSCEEEDLPPSRYFRDAWTWKT